MNSQDSPITPKQRQFGGRGVQLLSGKYLHKSVGDNTWSSRKQVIFCAAFVPMLYGVLFFPFTLFFAVYLFVAPVYGGAALLVLAGYITTGVIAWRRPSIAWTILFASLSAAPVAVQFVVLPALEQRHFREYSHISNEAKIVYYREAGIRDTTRFCLLQCPQKAPSPSDGVDYRPFLPGALATMKAVQEDLRIPDSRMPDPTKHSVTYSGGSNEESDGTWMHLEVYDSATAQAWYFEYGY